MKLILAIFLLLTSFFTLPLGNAHGRSLTPVPNNPPQSMSTLPSGTDFKALRKTGIGTVSHIISPYSVQMNDGRIMRLTALDFPDYNPFEAGPLSLIALNVLRDLLEGKAVNIYQTKNKNLGRFNRMAHHIAHIERQADEVWIQGTLVRLGLARVRTSLANPEMAEALYELERAARSEKLGLWEGKAFPVLSPDIKAEQYAGRYEIIEGKVISSALKNNRIYLNFGANWRNDFTVLIKPKAKRLFIKQGRDPLQWNGKTIRVRGRVQSYNGALIELTHPQALEIIEPDNNNAQNKSKTQKSNHQELGGQGK